MRERMNKRSKAMLLGFAFLIFLVSFTIGEEKPKIKFSEGSYDFGKVSQGQVLTHTFVFQNAGDTTLKIKKVSSSCGCTVALVSQKKAAPGEKGEIRVTFNSRGYKGNVKKYIYVESNDPTQSIKTLFITAEVDVPPRPKIYLARYSVDAGLFLQGEEIKTRIRISNRGELELRVDCSHKNATFFSGGKEITSPLKIPSGKSVEVEIKISPRRGTGQIREYILINSNDPDRKTLSFFLNGYILTKKQLKELFAKYRDVLD